MVQNANAKCVIECTLERQLKDVALDDMDVRHVAGDGKCRFDPVAQIDPHDFGSSPLGRQFSMPALAASALENDLVLKELRFYRLQPAEKLVRIPGILLCKMRPLPTKIFGCLRLFLFDLAEICKTRYPANYAVLTRAFSARQHTANDLFTV